MSMCRTYLIACLLLASVSATAGAREWSAGLYSSPTGIGLQAQLPSGDGRETDIISVIADTYGLISGRTADIGVRVGYTHDYIISTYEADGFTMNFHAGAGLTVGYVHDGENGSILGTGEALQKEMGVMAALSGSIGLRFDFTRNAAIDFGLSANPGVHLRMDRENGSMYLSFYRNGLFHALLPHISIMYRF